MCSAGRLEVGLDPDVDLHLAVRRATAEPDPAAAGQTGRFGYLGESQQPAVERPAGVLTPWRAGEVHVVETDDRAHRWATTNIRRYGRTVPYSRAG